MSTERLTKNVGGRIVELTPEEEAAVRAEWAANDPSKLPPPGLIDPSELALRLMSLSDAQVDAIRNAVGSNRQAFRFWTRLQMRGKQLDMNDPDWTTVWNQLEQLIGVPDANRILAELRTVARRV